MNKILPLILIVAALGACSPRAQSVLHQGRNIARDAQDIGRAVPDISRSVRDFDREIKTWEDYLDDDPTNDDLDRFGGYEGGFNEFPNNPYTSGWF